LVRDFLWVVERPDRRLADRTYYDHAIQIQADYRDIVESESPEEKAYFQGLINKSIKSLMDGYETISEARYRFDGEKGRY
jgi:hypothetical protein